jgi:hypothetical protein
MAAPAIDPLRRVFLRLSFSGAWLRLQRKPATQTSAENKKPAEAGFL